MDQTDSSQQEVGLHSNEARCSLKQRALSNRVDHFFGRQSISSSSRWISESNYSPFSSSYLRLLPQGYLLLPRNELSGWLHLHQDDEWRTYLSYLWIFDGNSLQITFCEWVLSFEGKDVPVLKISGDLPSLDKWTFQEAGYFPWVLHCFMDYYVVFIILSVHSI